MTYTVKFTTAYKKSYKLMKKRGLDLTLLDDVVDDLRQGKALDEKYKDHILKGDYAGFHECHIKPDWLLIVFQVPMLKNVLVDRQSQLDFGCPTSKVFLLQAIQFMITSIIISFSSGLDSAIMIVKATSV